MIIGQTLHSVGTAVFKTYYSPWMKAEGNLAIISCDVINTESLTDFTITVQTKNSEQSDKDAAAPTGGTSNNITLTTETITKFNVGAKLSDTSNAGFKELFRYKYIVQGNEFNPINGFVHFRMLDPAWLSH